MSKIIYTLFPVESFGDTQMARRANTLRNKIRIEMKRGRFSLIGVEQDENNRERYIYQN